jgi:N4-gp56 family major capsid protein
MANTAGTVGGGGSPQGGMQGWDPAVNTQPIPMSLSGTLAAGTAGTAWAGTPNASFAKVVTNLVLRSVIENLRTRAVIMQETSYIRAKQVPGTNALVYTAFQDLGAADTLLEGVPPETSTLAFDTFTFTGIQKGKVVAITDLAALLSPFELYSIAAEKVSWNAVDTAEKDAATLIQGANKGVVIAAGTTLQPAQNFVKAIVALKQAEVPPFPDGYYRVLISPADAATFMLQTGELGWTDTMKYASSEQLLNGEIGKFRGARFIESNRIADHKTVIYGPDFFAWGDYQSIQAYRVAPGGDHADPLAQRGLVGWKGMWGMSIVEFDAATVGPASNPKGYRYTQVDLTL